MKLSKEIIGVVVNSIDYETMLADLLDKFEESTEEFDEDDFRNGFAKMFQQAAQECEATISIYFADRLIYEECASILEDFQRDGWELRFLVSNLLDVDLRGSKAWGPSEWEGFVMENIWGYLKGETHRLSSSSSGSLLEGILP